MKKISEEAERKLLKVRKKRIFLQITSFPPIVLLEMLIEGLTNPLNVCAPEFRNFLVEVQKRQKKCTFSKEVISLKCFFGQIECSFEIPV